MSIVSVSLPVDGSTASVSQYNTPINSIVNVMNGGIDNSNISSTAAIDGAKLAGVKVSRSNNGTTVTENSAKFQSGWAAGTVTGSANNRCTVTVTFPLSFVSVPIITATFSGDQAGGTISQTGGGDNVTASATTKVISKTTTGFTVVITNTTGNFPVGTNGYIDWLAVGI